MSLKSGKVVHVLKKLENGDYQGHCINLGKLRPVNGIPDLPWSLIGVHRNLGMNTSSTHTFSRQDVVGKMMNCGELLCEWLPDWIMSKTD